MPLNQQCKVHSDRILNNENESIITFEGSFEYSIHNANIKRRIEVIRNKKTHDYSKMEGKVSYHKSKEKAVISQTNTIGHPWTMMIILHDTTIIKRRNSGNQSQKRQC